MSEQRGMMRRSRSVRPLVLVGVAVVVSGAVVGGVVWMQGGKGRKVGGGVAATTRAVVATSRGVKGVAASRPYVPRTLFEVLEREVPGVAATRPFEVPLDLRDAAHYVMGGPVYLDRGRLDLWVTRASGLPAGQVLKGAGEEQTHVVRERVWYVHWQPDDSGNWFPYLVVEGADGGKELVYPSGKRVGLARRGYEFGRAISFNDRMAVPVGGGGVDVIRVGDGGVEEAVHELPGMGEGTRRASATAKRGALADKRPVAQEREDAGVQLLLDYRGLMAFVPSTETVQGSRGVARFVEGRWEDLTPEKGFPGKVLHLMPLLDGSVMVIVPTSGGKVELELVTLDGAGKAGGEGNGGGGAGVDEGAVTKLVEQLSDEKEEVRGRAYEQLTRYGPAVFPVLERLMGDQPPEAKVRLQQLLRAKLKPTLGPASLVNGELKLVSRSRDGTAVFYSGAGVTVPTASGETETITPAWLALRPGMAVRLLPEGLTKDLDPGKARIEAVGNEWVVGDEVRGPCRFFGNELVPLLKEGERGYSEVVGIDRRGRWLFREPKSEGAATRATTEETRLASEPAKREGGEGRVLVVDPTLADPTPRLPAWVLEVKDEARVGWDRKGWPAMKAGGSGFVLREGDWGGIEGKDGFSNTVEDGEGGKDKGEHGRVAHATSEAATVPASGPATAIATTEEELGEVVGVGMDGTRYYDGRTRIVAVGKDGRRVEWGLPAEDFATVERPVVIGAEGHVFLFNQAGKCVRMSPNPAGGTGGEAYKVDAVFTKNVPNVDRPLRIWLDPAGRICFAADERHLVLFFPSGRIPQEIAEKMPADQLDAARE